MKILKIQIGTFLSTSQYYTHAGVVPSEALIERFYSIAGFVWNNRRYRYNLDTKNVSTITMKHLLYKHSLLEESPEKEEV